MAYKKGITPIMGGLLLVSFAVAVSVVVLNLGQAKTEDSASCPTQIALVFAKIAGKEQVCLNAASKELKFTVENGVNVKVEGLIINVIGSQKAESKEFSDAKMGRAGNYLGTMTYDKTVSGDIKQLKVTPLVIFSEKEQVCTDQALVIEQVGEC